jgi:opacity protein-like surface antigen
MKNIKNIAITILVTLAMPAMAQIPKGTSTIGGSISIYHDKTEYNTDPRFTNASSEYSETAISFAPGYGYFVANNFCVGLNLSAGVELVKSTLSNGSEGESNLRNLGLGPFVRYYLPLNSKLYGYGAAGYNWLWHRGDSDSYSPYDNSWSSSKIKSNASNYNVGLGLSYFINPNTAVEGGLQFTHINESDSENATNTLALNIGFRIFLRKSE